MAARFIVSKDRDYIYRFRPDVLFYTNETIYDGILMGYNLMMDDVHLGTFESTDEVIKEVSAIFNCTDEIYAISGYSNGGFAQW